MEKLTKIFCGKKKQYLKTVGLVGDSGIGKTRKLSEIRGRSFGIILPTKDYEKVTVQTKRGFVLVLDISGDIETIKNPSCLVSRCDLLFGVSGSSPELLNYWRDVSRETKCFFELVELENLEQRLEKI
nr:putative P-loop kinase [Marseillevirus cajuinensis]